MVVWHVGLLCNIRHHTETILSARWNITDALGIRAVMKVNLEFTGSRSALVNGLTLECQVFYIDVKVCRYREFVIVTRGSLWLSVFARQLSG